MISAILLALALAVGYSVTGGGPSAKPFTVTGGGPAAPASVSGGGPSAPAVDSVTGGGPS